MAGAVVNMIVATLERGFSCKDKVVAREKIRMLSAGVSTSMLLRRLATSFGVSVVFGRPRNLNTVFDHLDWFCSIAEE